MFGAQITLMIVSEFEWKSLRISARVGSPNSFKTSDGFDIARARTSRTDLCVGSLANAARHSVTNCSSSNMMIPSVWQMKHGHWSDVTPSRRRQEWGHRLEVDTICANPDCWAPTVRGLI